MTISTVFFGSSSFSVPFLQFCFQHTNLKAIVTVPDKPKGRGNKTIPNIVKQTAEQWSLPVFSPHSLSGSNIVQTLSKYNPTLFVTASYGKIIPPQVLSIPSLYPINIHPSLLPKYRGADPLFWQLAKEEDKAGVTLFKMTASLDDGPIIKQSSFQIHPAETYESLEQKSIRIGNQLLEELFHSIENNLPIPLTPQPKECPFYARKRTSEDEIINWNQKASTVLSFIRAFPPGNAPYSILDGKRLKIQTAESTLLNPFTEKIPGTLLFTQKKVLVQCKDTPIQLTEVQPEGKKVQKAMDFANGYLKKNVLFSFSTT